MLVSRRLPYVSFFILWGFVREAIYFMGICKRGKISGAHGRVT